MAIVADESIGKRSRRASRDDAPHGAIALGEWMNPLRFGQFGAERKPFAARKRNGASPEPSKASERSLQDLRGLRATHGFERCRLNLSWGERKEKKFIIFRISFAAEDVIV